MITNSNVNDLIYDMVDKFLEKFGVQTSILTNYDTDIICSYPIIKYDIDNIVRQEIYKDANFIMLGSPAYVITNGSEYLVGILWN